MPDMMILCYIFKLKTINGCQSWTARQELYSELYAYPIESNALCEAQLLNNFKAVPDKINNKSLIIFSQAYNVQKLERSSLLEPSVWLVVVFAPKKTKETNSHAKCSPVSLWDYCLRRN